MTIIYYVGKVSFKKSYASEKNALTIILVQYITFYSKKLKNSYCACEGMHEPTEQYNKIFAIRIKLVNAIVTV